jgi:hypothetical protein
MPLRHAQLRVLLVIKRQISWQEQDLNIRSHDLNQSAASVGVTKKAVRDWTNINHKKHWESTTGLKQAKGLMSDPSAKRMKDLLKLNRDQLRWTVEKFTGHCHLKGHLFKLGLTDDPTCEWGLEDDKSATRILCDCEAISYLRFRHLGQYFMEPSDYYDVPINKVLHFVRSVGLIKGKSKRGSIIDQ